MPDAPNLTAAQAPTGLKQIGATKTSRLTLSRYMTIGDMILAEDEHPDDITFGVIPKWAFHELIGGTVDAQFIGYTYRPVEWQGKLYGGTPATGTHSAVPSTFPSLMSRARKFDTMAASGAEYRLKWLDYRFDVVITTFEVTWKHRNEYTYKMGVRPLRDVSGRYEGAAAPIVAVDKESLDLLTQIQKNLANLTAKDTSVSTIANSVGIVTNAIAQAGSLAQAFLSGSLSSIVSAISDSIGLASAYSTTAAQFFGNAHVVQALTLANALIALKATVQRGQAPSSIIVMGGSLASIAAQFYGDASLGRALGDANGIHGMSLPRARPTTLRLVPLASTAVVQ